MLNRLNKKYILIAVFFVVIHSIFIGYVTSLPLTTNYPSIPHDIKIEYEHFIVVSLMLPLIIPNSIGLPVFINAPFIAAPNILGYIYLLVFWFLLYWLVISIVFKVILKLKKYIQI